MSATLLCDAFDFRFIKVYVHKTLYIFAQFSNNLKYTFEVQVCLIPYLVSVLWFPGSSLTSNSHAEATAIDLMYGTFNICTVQPVHAVFYPKTI